MYPPYDSLPQDTYHHLDAAWNNNPYHPQEDNNKHNYPLYRYDSPVDPYSIPSSPSSSSTNLSVEDDVKLLFYSCPNEIRRALEHLSDSVQRGLLHSNSSDSLNPLAMPFVPTTPNTTGVYDKDLLTPRVPASDLPLPSHPPKRQHNVPLPHVYQNRPPWFPAFWAGVNSSDDSVQQRFALSLVTGGDWLSSPRSLGELAQYFVWRASCLLDGISGVESAKALGIDIRFSLFALNVFHKFWQFLSEEAAAQFIWYLGDSVVRVFTSTWDINEQLDRFHPKADEYLRTPSQVFAGLALASFIGDLYQQSLLRNTHLNKCLRILKQNLYFVEHVDALRSLVCHAGPSYWRKTDEINNFLATVLVAAGRVRDEASLCGQAREEGQVMTMIDDVSNVLKQWNAETRVYMQ
ncbi:hypothetical protein AMATHDRAFT_53806 [Amanita thiersii Skay4041]|uniref:Uncharacterized protein n=1 Tax=Amanita thiersii Skay4041 TaxID=703135 RepID=A0A2A9NV95_9AGAR|nr:hypothetical protein AMATHDRAFT_53806 [Amanita thiersii Skay4041]